MLTLLCLLGLLMAIAGVVVSSAVIFSAGSLILVITICTEAIVKALRGRG